MPSRLRPYQEKALRETPHPRVGLCHSPRLGKTFVALAWMVQIRPRRGLVTCPLTVGPMWAALLRAEGFEVLEGYKGAVKTVAGLLSTFNGVLVVNDDRLCALQPALLKWAPTLVVGDESHRFRGVSSKRGKAMRRICWQAEHVRMLTGTPAPNHEGNMWGPSAALRPDIWGRSYEKFAKEHLIRDHMFPSKVLGLLQPDKLRAMIRETWHFLDRKDVFGNDKWQTVVRDVEMPGKARKQYDTLLKSWLIEDKEQNLTVSADIIITRLLRLQQITSGFVKDDEGRLHHLHNAKIDAVMADLEEIIDSGEKVAIFYRFAWEAQAYAERLKTADYSFVRIAGDVSSAERQSGITAFAQKHGGPSIALVQTQAGGVGISLSAASHAFFVSQLFSYDDEEQARDRIFEPGVNKTVTYYRVPHTVDGYIASVLSQKATIHGAVTGVDFKALAEGLRPQTKGFK